MKNIKEIGVLKGEIQKTIDLVQEIDKYYHDVHKNEMKKLGKTRSTALIIAQIIENFYTCLETTFLRISQFFENTLYHEKWHSDLLRKMNLNIKGIREAVICDETYKHLDEILRFRHFKRYYFELDYSWEKLDYTKGIYEKAKNLAVKDLKKFTRFLNSL